MTDKTYKLVPTSLSPEMRHTGDAIIDGGGSMHAMWDGMLEVAPEPVCEWTFVGIGFDSECGWHVEPSHGEYSHDSPYPFCPHCGRKTEVVEDE